MNIQDSFIQLDTQPIQNHQTITRKDSQSMNSKKYNRAVGDSEEEDDLPEESINCDCGGTKDDAGMVICDSEFIFACFESLLMLALNRM